MKRTAVVYDCSRPACPVRDVPPPLAGWLVVVTVAGPAGDELLHFHSIDCLASWSAHQVLLAGAPAGRSRR